MTPFLLFVIVLLLLLVIGIAGHLIARGSKEELSSGRKYFLIAEPIALLAAFLLLFFNRPSLVSGVILLILFVANILIRKEIYSFMLLGLALAFAQETILLYLASMITLYFLISSALTYAYFLEKKTLKPIILNYFSFLLIAIVGKLITTFL